MGLTDRTRLISHHIMPLVINDLAQTHTYTHTDTHTNARMKVISRNQARVAKKVLQCGIEPGTYCITGMFIAH